ncbi:MAG: GSU2403 family nucleotidyltransferase fold protein [Oligoflexales bacterium]
MNTPEIAMLEELAEIIGPHKNDIVLCGGMAVYALYSQGMSGFLPTHTEDIDLVLERTKRIQKTLNDPTHLLSQSLHNKGYKAIPFRGISEDGLQWEQWESENSDFHIEFLTYDHNNKIYKISGVAAQGLSYFAMSLNNTVEITLPSNATLRVVSAATCILHKALTYNRRSNDLKKHKDLYYICYLSLTLFNNLDEMAEAIKNLDAMSKWITDGFKSMSKVHSEIDAWIDHIIAQDQQGFLNKENVSAVFEKFSTS